MLVFIACEFDHPGEAISLLIMDISADQIASKKKVGTLNGDPVFELATTGGLHLMVRAKGGKNAEVISAGPHRAVARHIAKKRNPDLKISELAKADHIPEEYFQSMLPYWEEVTDKFRNIP